MSEATHHSQPGAPLPSLRPVLSSAPHQSALLDLGFEDIYQETREKLVESLKGSNQGCEMGTQEMEKTRPTARHTTPERTAFLRTAPARALWGASVLDRREVLGPDL